MRDEILGQRFGRLRAEETGMRIRQAIELPVDGGKNIGMCVPHARDGRAARPIDVPLAFAVNDLAAIRRIGQRIALPKRAMQDKGYGGSPGARREHFYGIIGILNTNV